MSESVHATPRHGGIVVNEVNRLGLTPDQILDVSVNVNPYGPCPTVAAAIRGARIDRYPDPTAAPARLSLANSLGVSPDRVVAGNGAVDILWSITRCLVRPGDRVLVVEPAFSEVRAAAAAVGGSCVSHTLHPDNDFAFDAPGLDRAIASSDPRLVYVATPANPTGKSIPIETLVDLAERHKEATFVVDLSFAAVSSTGGDIDVRASDRIVWVRSLTKEFALPGLRVGFGVMFEDLARRMEAQRPPWSINALAQAAAIACVTAEAELFVRETRDRWIADRARMDDALRKLALRPHRSDTVYSFVDLGPHVSATRFRARLLENHAVLVRDGSTFGLPHHIRLGARPKAEEGRLLEALAIELAR